MASAGLVEVGLRLTGARLFQQAAAGAAQSLRGIQRSSAAAAQQLQAAQAGLMAVTRAGAMLSAGGAAAGFGMWKAARAAGEFEKKMAIVGKVSRSTAADLKLQEEAAMQAGIATQYSPLQAAEGMEILAQAGYKALGQTQMLLPVLDLAAAGQISLADAAATTNRVLSIYGKDTRDAAKVNDMMVGTTQMLDINMQKMANAIGKTAGKTQLLGQEFKTTLLMLGLGHAALGDVNLASTANSAALARMMTNTQALNHLDKMGIKVVDEKLNKNRQIVDILLDLEEGLKGVGAAEKNKILVETLGIRGMGAYTAVVSAKTDVMKNGRLETLRGADAIRHLKQEQDKLSGSTESFREAIKATFAGKVTYMMGSFQTLVLNIGQSFASVFGPAIDAITYTLNGLIAVVRALPTWFKNSAAAAAAFGAATMVMLGTALVAFGTLGILVAGIAAGVAALPATIAAVKTAFATLAGGVSAALAPLIPIILAVSAAIMSVALVVGLLYEYNRKGLMDISGAWKSFTDWISDVISTAVKFWVEVWDAAMEALFSSTSWAWSKIISFINKAINKVMGLIGSIIDTYGELLFAMGYEQEARGLRNLRDELKNFDADIGAMAKTINEEFVKPAMATVKRVAGEAFDLGAEIANNTLEGFGEALDGLGHMAEDLLGPVADIASEVGEKIQKKFNEQLQKAGAAGAAAGGGGAAGGAGWDEDAYAKKMRKQNQDERKARSDQRAQEKQDKQMGAVGAVSGAMQGNVGAMVSGIAAAAGSAFGPVGSAVAGAADQLIGMSKEGAKFKEALGGIFVRLAKALNPVFKALMPILNIFEPLADLIGMIVEVSFAFSLLQPALWVVGKVLTAVAVVIASLQIAFRAVWIGILELLNHFVDYSREIAELNRAQATAVRERNEMMERFADNDAADEQRARRERELARATRDATSAMLNVPSGYKVARAGFGAEVPVMDDFMWRPGQGAVEFSPDDTIIGVKDTQALGATGGPTIIIENLSVEANNPTSFIRQLMSVVGSDTMAGGVALGGAWQGRP